MENTKIQIERSEIKILSKIVSVHVKLAIKCIQTSREEKFKSCQWLFCLKAASGHFVQKLPVVTLFKSIQWSFCSKAASGHFAQELPVVILFKSCQWSFCSKAAGGNFVQKLPVAILFKSDCSVRHMFCIFLKNTFEVVNTYRPFSRKIHIHMENLLSC